jgi:hypothetical protein
MSVLRPLHSSRGRLVFVTSALLLIAALVAAPGVSSAASVKQFTAIITPDTATGGVSGTWTEQVKNCGTPVEAPCTASSTIAIGQVRITVPAEFRSDPFSFSADASDGNNWTATYNPGTGVIVAQAVTGNDKLNSGELVDIEIVATPECIAGSKQFTTTAVGGLPNGPNNQTFAIVGSQPSVTIAGCQLAPGGTATDPETGQTETIEGDFTGHVNVTFGGVGPDCGGPEFGTLGDQWQVYHLPSPVNITPVAGDFHAGPSDKVSTSEFDQDIFGGDSSWYLICFAVPQAGHTAFETRGGGTAVAQTIDGVPAFVGILASCVDADTPCVSEQFLTTGPGSNPSLWDPAQDRVHIAIRMDTGDPWKR